MMPPLCKKHKLSCDDSTKAEELSEKEALAVWDLIRGCDLAMTTMYGFLDYRDRVHFGQVDKAFYRDERRGKIEGVYGPRNYDIVAAFGLIREYLEAEGKPSMMHKDTARGAETFSWSFREKYTKDFMKALPYSEWFDTETGLYNLEKIGKSNYTADIKRNVADAFVLINQYRTIMLRKMRAIEHEISKMSKPAPFKALFRLMEKHRVEYNKLVAADDPLVPLQCPILHRDNRESLVIPCLFPGRALLYKDVNGLSVTQVLRACSKCQKIIPCRMETCRNDFCGGPTCQNCATVRTCSTCGKSGCPCRFARCAVCPKAMCNCSDFAAGNRLQAGASPGCVFVRTTQENRWISVTPYCQEHRPAGATPYREVMW